MIIEKTFYEKNELEQAKRTGDDTRVFVRKVRLSTTDSNKYYAKAVLVGNKENILTGEVIFTPEMLTSREGITTSNIIVEETADVEEYFKNLVRFEGYEVLQEWNNQDSPAHYSGLTELSLEANRLLFLNNGVE